MDISLDIKNAHNIQRAFENYVKVEFLEGDNTYNCAKWVLYVGHLWILYVGHIDCEFFMLFLIVQNVD